MTKPNAKAVALLRRVQAHILEEPKRFVMDAFIEHGTPGVLDDFDGLTSTFAPCGTAACIAGWTAILTHKGESSYGLSDVRAKAERALRIPSEQSQKLFFVTEWPSPFKVRYTRAKTRRAKAKVACARIDHFIETGE